MTDENADKGPDETADEDADELFDGESVDGTDDIDDPFAQLDEDESRANGDAEGPLFGEAKTGTEIDDRDPVETDDDDEVAADTGSAVSASRTEADNPFDELGPATDESGADLDEAFERMDVGDLTEEDVWKSLDKDGAVGGEPVGEFGGTVSEVDATGTGVGGGFANARAGVERVISKRTYCQQCPHFSAPPKVACGHEGTAIVEVVGFDEFRVRNCPMVDDDDPTFDAPHEE